MKLLRPLALIWVLLLSAFALADPGGLDAAQGLLQHGQIGESLQLLRAYAQAYPNNAEGHHLLSRAYYAVDNWNQAIKEGEQAVKLAPDNSAYHLWLGRAYGRKAEHCNFICAFSYARKVRVEFERAVQLNSEDSAARTDLAEFYIEAPGFLGGGKDKAQAQAQALDRKDRASALWVRARLAEDSGDLGAAEQSFKDAIQASGNAPEQWVDLASFYRRHGRLDDMQHAIQQAIASQKRQSNALFDAAMLLFRSGRDFTGAAKLVRLYLNSGQTVEAAPPFRAHYLLGAILEKLGDKTGAATEYQKALALAGDYPEARDALERVRGQ